MVSALGKKEAGSSRVYQCAAAGFYWEMPVWRFVCRTPGVKDISLGWSFKMPSGRTSFDSPELLESFRLLTDSVLSPGGLDGRRLASGSMTWFGTGIRTLWRWMDYHGYKSLGSLTPDVIQAYLEDLPFVLVDGVSFYSRADASFIEAAEDDDDSPDEVESAGNQIEHGEPDLADFFSRAGSDGGVRGEEESPEKEEEADEEVDFDEQDGLSYSVVVNRLRVVQLVFHGRHVLKRLGLPYMSEDPFRGEPTGKIAKRLSQRVSKIIPPLPDEVLLGLLRPCQEWVEHKANEVITLLREYINIRGALRSGANNGVARRRLSKLLAGHVFSPLPGHAAPWCGPLVQDIELNAVTGDDFLASGSHRLRRLVQNLQAACALVLLHLVGMRPSEVLALLQELDCAEKWPSCIRTRYSRDGLLELFFLHGFVTKGRGGERVPANWIAAARPAGSTWLPLPIRAVLILRELHECWRQLGVQDKELFLSMSNPVGIAQVAESLSPTSNALFIRCMRVFIREEVDFVAMPDQGKMFGEDLTKFKRLKGGNIIPRHGRKTFVNFMLLTKFSRLEPVRMHLKHLTSVTTEDFYFSQGDRLRQSGFNDRAAATTSFITSILLGRKVEGRMAETIDAYFNRPEFTEAKSTGELYRRVEEVVLSSDLRVFFHDHGACFITARPHEAACRRADAPELKRWLFDEPNAAVRTPGLCAGCGCFLMDKSHLPFWIERAAQVVVGDSRENRVTLFNVAQAAKVVQLMKRKLADDGITIESE